MQQQNIPDSMSGFFDTGNSGWLEQADTAGKKSSRVHKSFSAQVHVAGKYTSHAFGKDKMACRLGVFAENTGGTGTSRVARNLL
jgi:hypothetical protein